MRDSLEDFKKKYRDTYCFLSLNEKEFLVFFGDDNGDDSFYLDSPEYGEIIVDRETIYSCLRPAFPKTGLYNLNGNAIEYNKVPERQWKRAPCSANSKLYPILSYIGVNTNSDCRITLHNLEEVFKEKYPKNLDDAIGNLKYSQALSRKFAISQTISGKSSDLLLWYRSQPIGLLDTVSREVTIKYNHLYQEALDFFRKKETTWTMLPKNKQ